jgi:lysophospholipase L1-like esterase
MLSACARLFAVAVLATPAVGAGIADASAPRVYLGLGDSVAVGYAAPPGQGYVERYGAYLRDPARGGIDRTVKLAVPGETSDSMRRPGGQLERAVDVIRRSSNVRVVTLDIGGNDVLNRLCPAGFGHASCQYETNFRAILDALGAALAGDPGREKLQVMEYYNPAAGTPLGAVYAEIGLGADGRVDCSGSGADRGLNDVITCVGAEHGAQAVDPYLTAMAIGSGFMGDSIHPSAKGHAAIACLFEHLERAGSAAPCRELRLTGAPSQRVLEQRAVVVAVRTGHPATVTVSARVKIPGPAPDATSARVTTDLVATKKTVLELRLGATARRSIRRALSHHRRLSAAVTVTATRGDGRATGEAATFRVIR